MASEKKQRIGIVFHRFGPYHIARINALANHFDVVGIELSSTSKEYKWDKVEGNEIFKRVTLFNEIDSRDASIELLRGKIYECLEKNPVDALCINGWGDRGGLICLEWCVKRNVRTILMTEEVEATFKRTFVKEWPKKRLVDLFDSALVGGKPQARYLNKLGMPVDYIKEGYDIVDNNYYIAKTKEARENQQALREKLALPNNYFLTSNRFIPKKNLFRLLEAYKSYTIQRPIDIWKLILLGDGELKEELIEKIETLKLQKHVIMPGFLQYGTLPHYYALATVFIHSSTSEQWGLVVNEAMASSLPVLVSDQCGCAENLVQDGVNGFVFNPFDVEDMAQKIIAITDLNSDQLSRFGLKSLEIVEQYNPTLFGKAVETLMRSMTLKPRVTGIKRKIAGFVLSLLLKLNKLK
jgi:1,2-diacylglycerol 3-alpha-glucosyltransferase